MAAQLIPGDAHLNNLANVLHSLQNPAFQKQAEAHIDQARLLPGYSLSLLKLSQYPNLDPLICLGAALQFKNTAKARWKELPDDEKTQIKGVLVNLILSSSPAVRKALAEGLCVIANAEPLSKWPSLLSDMLQRLAASDAPTRVTILHLMHRVLLRFRVTREHGVLVELKPILNLLAPPLLQLWLQTSATVQQHEQQPLPAEQLVACVSALHRIAKIYYTLNYVDLPEVFEDHLPQWMEEFHRYLTYKVQNAASAAVAARLSVHPTDADKPGPLQKLQAAIAHVLNLYIERYEEEIQPFLSTLIGDLWNLLINTTAEAKFDRLVSATIQVITQTARGVHANTLFGNEAALRQICEHIVVPNVMFRQSDEETFKDNPQEYIRRDYEGSNEDTRRRAACELLGGLRKRFESQVTQIVAGYVQQMLAQFAAEPKKQWRQKDAAVYLVTALAAGDSTREGGVLDTNPLVPVLPFFTAQVLPELQPTSRTNAVLEADALKFVLTFRRQLPRDAGLQLFPVFARLLASDNYVVHSYAAICVDRFLVLKDPKPDDTPRPATLIQLPPGAGGTAAAIPLVPRYHRADLQPVLGMLIGGLFRQLSSSASETRDNEYIMKAVVRIVAFGGDLLLPFAADLLKGLATLLYNVARNPAPPQFSHNLFDAIGALAKTVVNASGAADARTGALQQLEASLLPSFSHIMQQNVSDYVPYVYQLLALLLELSPPEVPPSALYTQLFPSLIAPSTYSRSAVVPPVVRLVQAYIRHAGTAVATGGQLPGVLGVFKMLLEYERNGANLHEVIGIQLLTSVVQYVPLEAMAQLLPVALQLLLAHVQKRRNVRVVSAFLQFLGRFVCARGPNAVVAALDSQQAGLFRLLLEKVWLAEATKLVSVADRRLCAIALVRLLTESTAVLSDDAMWLATLSTVLQVIEQPLDVHDVLAEADEVARAAAAANFSALGLSTTEVDEVLGGYVELVFAARTEDSFRDVDVRRYVVTQLHTLASNPQCAQRAAQLVAALPPPAATQLRNYYTAAGVQQFP